MRNHNTPGQLNIPRPVQEPSILRSVQNEVMAETGTGENIFENPSNHTYSAAPPGGPRQRNTKLIVS
jgi:hypothetical protein